MAKLSVQPFATTLALTFALSGVSMSDALAARLLVPASAINIRPPNQTMLVQWGGAWGPQSQQEDPNIRINALEGRVRQLTGQIEQMQFQVKRLEDQLKRFQEDTDFRFQEQQQQGAGASNTPGRRPQPQRPAQPGTQQRGEAPLADPSGPLALTPQIGGPAPVVAGGRGQAPGSQPILGTPPQVLGQIPADPNGGQPVDLSAPARSAIATATLPNVSSPSGPREAYDQAYGFILHGEYDRADLAFRAYLSAYPNDRQSGDALYWLGESQFQRQQWKASAESFLKSYNDYPNGAKAPESLLRLGMSLRQLGQKEPACATFNEVLRKYPRASPAVKQRVQSEQRSAAC